MKTLTLLIVLTIAQEPQPIFTIYQQSPTGLVRVLPGGTVSNTIVLVAEFNPTVPTNLTVTLKP